MKIVFKTNSDNFRAFETSNMSDNSQFFSEAEKMELINAAVGSAEAVVAAGRARAQSIELVAKALCDVNGQV